MIPLELNRKQETRDKLDCVRIRRNPDPHSVISCVYYFSDKKSERAKDLHLVKKLAALLRAKSPRPGRCR